jgi:hypothetical protein
MANITQHLMSLFLDSRSGSPPGRRLLALTLVVMLACGSIPPGFALAGESDSEGEGTAPPAEVPVDPGFDPGGEEEALEETPAAGGDAESGAVEPEPEVDPLPPETVTGVAAEAPGETEAPQIASTTPESIVPAPASEPETTQQTAAEELAPAEPVANQSIAAPPQKSGNGHTGSATTITSSDTAPSTEFSEETSSAPSRDPATAPADVPGHLAGRDSYVVRPGDCLWHIAAALLPAGASDAQIVGEVARLWGLNESRIGTGDPSLIYAGTELRLA